MPLSVPKKQGIIQNEKIVQKYKKITETEMPMKL